MADTDQTPFAVHVAEYERLRTLASACGEADDEEGFDAAYDQAERVRELIFATPARTKANAALKLRFVVQIARERDFDLHNTGTLDGVLDVARFLEA